eukprot:evm.model.scf_772EXC.7 EVM.evm.TU.scf_772EXC.7   scf_772EXC:53561-60533(-)
MLPVRHAPRRFALTWTLVAGALAAALLLRPVWWHVYATSLRPDGGPVSMRAAAAAAQVRAPSGVDSSVGEGQDAAPGEEPTSLEDDYDAKIDFDNGFNTEPFLSYSWERDSAHLHGQQWEFRDWLNGEHGIQTDFLENGLPSPPRLANDRIIGGDPRDSGDSPAFDPSASNRASVAANMEESQFPKEAFQDHGQFKEMGGAEGALQGGADVPGGYLTNDDKDGPPSVPENGHDAVSGHNGNFNSAAVSPDVALQGVAGFNDKEKESHDMEMGKTASIGDTIEYTEGALLVGSYTERLEPNGSVDSMNGSHAASMIESVQEGYTNDDLGAFAQVSKDENGSGWKKAISDRLNRNRVEHQSNELESKSEAQGALKQNGTDNCTIENVSCESSAGKSQTAEEHQDASEGMKIAGGGDSEPDANVEATSLDHGQDVTMDDRNSSLIGVTGDEVEFSTAEALQWPQTSLTGRHALRERLASMATDDGYIVVTFCNLHFVGFAINWARHLAALGVSSIAVGAMDGDALRELQHSGINAFSMDSHMTTGNFGWGTQNFHLMGRKKTALELALVDMGLQVIITDVDTVWLRDPIEYFRKFPQADVLVSSDHLANTVADEGLELWPRAGGPLNIGILMLRPSSASMVKEWLAAVLKDDSYWDQNAFNDLLRQGTTPSDEGDQRLFLGFRRSLKVGVLPVSIFCSGHTYFVQGMPQRLGLKPYIVHTTFQFSGFVGKRNRFREALLWDDPPEYFDRPGGYLTFDMDVPSALLDTAGPRTHKIEVENVMGHFELVNHQIKQIRDALAIANALGRALIVPQMWCGLDRWWAPHAGRIPGSDFALPFRCPMDHIFDLENGWMRDFAEEDFGPSIDFREYSFLSNPRLPASVNASRIRVEGCDGSEDLCDDGSAQATIQNGAVRLRRNATDVQIATALSSARNVKILDFGPLAGVFGGHEDPAVAGRFMRRTAWYTGLWCCVRGAPGHVWYDMWWDTVPHVDRHGRVHGGPWKLEVGP